MSAAATATMVSFQAQVMPWEGSSQDDARFKRISRTVLIMALLLCVFMPLWTVPPVQRAEPAAWSPIAVKMRVQDMPARAPPPVLPLPAPVPIAKAIPQAEPTPVPLPARPQPVKEAPVQEARKPEPGQAPGEAIDAARRKAAGVGLLAMKDQLAELHDAPTAVQLKADLKPGPGVGTGKGLGVGAGAEPGVPARSLITSNATGGSGGINTAAYGRDTGGGGLAGRATTVVAGVASGAGGGGPGGRNGRGDGVGAGGSVQRGGSGKASRSLEDVKLVFERNKGAIYAIYNRALRDEPELQGKVVIELKISPAGTVTECRLVSSELKLHELEAKLLARIRQFDFGAKDVDSMVVTWPLDFLPS